jgi:hypothetical protein
MCVDQLIVSYHWQHHHQKEQNAEVTNTRNEEEVRMNIIIEKIGKTIERKSI